ncbi:type IV secretion system protein [Parasulfitobacter algicola]|uniref:Type IV secretion system protein n=1 Tax=Parasulfitobacter algicola TaxID=2614809 RepID=A0ABX2IWQ1_9RHOB|nr:type IV secretion system protein [Sulfitobacter algicola]NSX56795.1 type IV secretion system protein [Sulfitobacter algicola]
MKLKIISLAVLTAVATPALSQGIPTIDVAAIANAQLEFGQEITQMIAELEEARRLYESVNGFTNMDDIVGALNDPAVRELLGPDFMSVAGDLTAPLDSMGDLGANAQEMVDFTRITTEELNAEDFYRTELDRAAANAGRNNAVGDRIVQSADERLAGLEQLRQELGNVSTQKEMDALQGRIQIESAMLQNDTNRIQGLAMLQQAQAQLNEARSTESQLLKIQETKSAWEAEIE